ncbi:MAG TPA: PQQ-binding-like beta-propeller repeat protein, partial [Sphingomonadaceae bacterium]|nr:PQQ-binding-like beta-propeller repeat protein [Sphingomonadaceae bacterium]
MTFADKGSRSIRLITAALLLAALALLGQRLLAQAPPIPTPEERDRMVSEILAGHSDVSEKSRALGEAIYRRDCAACHDGGMDRAPTTDALGYIAPGAILRVLTDGKMREQAASLTQEEKVAVSEFISGRTLDSEAVTGPLMCTNNEGWFDLSQPPVLSGWGLDQGNAHSIPAAVSGLTRENIGSLELKWAFGFPDAYYSRSQPAIAGGALFVGGDDGNVYALDPASGCAHWAFHASGPVRMGIVAGDWQAGDPGAEPLLYFGDLLGNAYAVHARSGELAWRRLMDEHKSVTLTASPALHGGVVYFPLSSLEEPAAANPAYECCTFRGALAALAADTGEELWRSYMVDEAEPTAPNVNGVQQHGPSGVAIWATPLVDGERGLLYVVTG